MNPLLRVAEHVLPGHPDKLCDAIADRIVDRAAAADPDALVGVEVAVHRNHVFIDGRIAAGGSRISVDHIASDARAAFLAAGYDATWKPAPESLIIETDLCLEKLSKDERAIRSLSDDQNICIGYACGAEVTNFLPLEHFLAWSLARGMATLRTDRPDLRLGPDGKVIVAALETKGSFDLQSVSLSIQHEEAVDWVHLVRAARKLVYGTVERLGTAGCGIGPLRDDLRIEVNGGGQFTIGGPEGDNGLSGKKLVVDCFGPASPIGGGAISGKDPHKVDRAGALRARQLAREIVASGAAGSAQVTLAFYPGDTEPSHVGIMSDGRPMAPSKQSRWRRKHDLSIAGTNRELGLARIKWQPLAVWGHFTDASLPWEGA